MANTEPLYTEKRFTSLSVFSCILLALAVFGLAFVPMRGSQDEWWHLKTGQWIIQHGGLPTYDIFTYTGANMRWYNHEWLSQVIFYGAYRAAESLGFQGISGLIFFKSLVVVLAFALVAGLGRQRGITWPTACVIALVAADISRRTIFARPPIFSYVLLALTLLLLHAWKRGHLRLRVLWILVPITVLWANLHGMVLLAIVATGAYAAGELLDNAWVWWRRRNTDPTPFWPTVINRRAFTLLALTLAVILATMAQPSGYHLFLLGRNFTADPLLKNIILEMMPTPMPLHLINPTMPWSPANTAISPPGFWTFWIGIAIILVLFVRNRFRLFCAADYLLLIFFTWQAIAHWRLLPLFAIGAAGPTASLVHARLGAMRMRKSTLQAPVATLLLAALMVWFNFSVNEDGTYLQRNRELIDGKAANLFDYPAPLMDYIKEAQLPDNMLSDSNYCGFAMWHLSPERHKLFTDSRFDLFGSKFIHLERNIFFAATAGETVGNERFSHNWQDLLDQYNINFIVFRPVDRPDLLRPLLATKKWRLVYYYIPPGSNRREWPFNGNYVLVRESPETDEIARRSEAIFLKQSPNAITPAEMKVLIETQT